MRFTLSQSKNLVSSTPESQLRSVDGWSIFLKDMARQEFSSVIFTQTLKLIAHSTS